MSNPERYANVSHTQMSIARYYGGMRVNGQRYTYNPLNDELIRDDVLKREKQEVRKAKKAKLNGEIQAGRSPDGP
jgi:hypothetical protein